MLSLKLLAAALSLAMPLSALADPASVFRFRLASDPATLDWTRASTSYETYAIMNMMEGLIELDQKLTPVGALASSWEISKDGLTYTFKLKKDVKWSDGTPLTAKDFIFSWRRLLEPRTSNEYATFLFDIDGAEDFHKGRLRDFSKVGARALGPDTIELRLRRVVPYFVSLLSFWVTFPQREDLVKGKDWDTPKKLVVLGPYKVTQWNRGKLMVFERNDTYHGTRPTLDRIEAVIEPSDEKARQALLDGKLDALLGVNTEDIVQVTNDPTKQLRQFDYLATVFLAFNMSAMPTANSSLRRALAYALDRTGIPAALKGGETPAESIVPRSMAGYEPAAFAPSNESARRALMAAGFKTSSSVPPLALLCIEGRFRATAEYVRQALRAALDLEIDLKCVSPTDYARLRKAGKYQMLIAQWGADYPDLSSFMELFLSSNPYNYTGWKNARYDRLVREAGGSLKVLERLKTYAEAQKLLLQDDTVVIPLYYPKITALTSARVVDFSINPLNYLFFKRIIVK